MDLDSAFGSAAHPRSKGGLSLRLPLFPIAGAALGTSGGQFKDHGF